MPNQLVTDLVGKTVYTTVDQSVRYATIHAVWLGDDGNVKAIIVDYLDKFVHIDLSKPSTEWRFKTTER